LATGTNGIIVNAGPTDVIPPIGIKLLRKLDNAVVRTAGAERE
jgi:hypothetical protein